MQLAPTIVLSPITTPDKITVFAPIKQFEPITTSLETTAPGAIWTVSSYFTLVSTCALGCIPAVVISFIG